MLCRESTPHLAAPPVLLCPGVTTGSGIHCRPLAALWVWALLTSQLDVSVSSVLLWNSTGKPILKSSFRPGGLLSDSHLLSWCPFPTKESLPPALMLPSMCSELPKSRTCRTCACCIPGACACLVLRMGKQETPCCHNPLLCWEERMGGGKAWPGLLPVTLQNSFKA